MAAFDEIVKEVADEGLRRRLEDAFKKATKHRKFGLVFEEHLPEATALYGMDVKVGMTVATYAQDGGALFVVREIAGGVAKCVPVGSFSRGERGEHGESVGRVEVERGREDGRARSPSAPQEEVVEFKLDEIVPVAKFGEPIYPYLERMDAIEHGGGDLWHALIQSDNYHALQLLEYLYAGKVDCIYIDPPYNTGARDWKYNNDYVDSNDSWRHSKWLSMMQKRLAIAKRLLNPKDSVLIVTIDEKEYLHLGMLLEQMFPEARIQMVSSVINPTGSKRADEFSRTNEFLFFVRLGSCGIEPMDDVKTVAANSEVHWEPLRRHNEGNLRTKTNTQFYPIYIDTSTNFIRKIGDPVAKNIPVEDIPSLEGCETVLPIRDNGLELMWGMKADELKSRLSKGYVKIGAHTPKKPQKYVISYLTTGTIEDIETGKATTTGYDENGVIKAYYQDGKKVIPTTQWANSLYDAKVYGTLLLQPVLDGIRFSFPKSLYAVKDCLKLFVANKPNALIVDFFAGSGTTLHAVNLLNAEDGGKRRCILVTNNEVSDAEAKEFRRRGLKPGDAEWESRGIAQYVTWPRTTCSIRGVNVKGEALKGEYITVKGGALGDRALPMAEGFKSNCAFFKLGFLDKNAVSLGRAFERLLPLLWLKAGAVGRCPEGKSKGEKVKSEEGFVIFEENRMAVLMDEGAFRRFKSAVKAAGDIDTIYIVTDFEPTFLELARQFPKAKSYQIYRDYLDNFRINRG